MSASKLAEMAIKPHEHVARERAAVVLARAFEWGILE